MNLKNRPIFIWLFTLLAQNKTYTRVLKQIVSILIIIILNWLLTFLPKLCSFWEVVFWKGTFIVKLYFDLNAWHLNKLPIFLISTARLRIIMNRNRQSSIFALFQKEIMCLNKTKMLFENSVNHDRGNYPLQYPGSIDRYEV